MKVVTVMTVEGFVEIEDEDEPTMEEMNIEMEELEAEMDLICEIWTRSSSGRNPRVKLSIKRVR